MKPKYLCLYDSWQEETDQLTHEEKGRLIDACMAYFTGADHKQLLTGNERFVFGTFKSRIDANIAAYERKCEQNARNIKKRWEKEPNTDDTDVYDGIRSNTNVYDGYQYNKIKENTIKEKPKQTNTKNARAIDQAEKAGLIRTETDRIRLDDLISVYGIDKVLHGIDQADRNGGRSIEYVKKVCENAGKGKTVPAQEYTQREYTESEDYLDRILTAEAEQKKVSADNG